jgi:hypothetical protein
MVLISARDEPAERWCVANECRHADAVDICFFLIRFNASHIVFLEICPSEEVFEGNK